MLRFKPKSRGSTKVVFCNKIVPHGTMYFRNRCVNAKTKFQIISTHITWGRMRVRRLVSSLTRLDSFATGGRYKNSFYFIKSNLVFLWNIFIELHILYIHTNESQTTMILKWLLHESYTSNEFIKSDSYYRHLVWFLASQSILMWRTLFVVLQSCSLLNQIVY